MACFLVPAAEAVVTTVVTKVLRKKESQKKAETVTFQLDDNTVETGEKIPFSEKMKWLNKLLWGGSGLLAFEHVWHGEVIPVFPFLTAVKDGNAVEMLHEMATTGVSMALLVTAVWGLMVGIVSLKEKLSDKKPEIGIAAGGLA